MIDKIPLEKVLFLDIETVPMVGEWKELSPKDQEMWEKKTERQRPDTLTASEFFEQRGGIMAEFGKIICISVGMQHDFNSIKIRSFADDDEMLLLAEFSNIFEHEKLQNVILCAHNGKEFDFPWIARRFLINGMMPPVPFQMFGKKPWEIPHLDTMELWKFGDYKTFISLELLAHIFKIPTPKDDISGADVAQVYYKDKDLKRIVTYCEKDVLTLANILRRMRQEELYIRSI